MNINFVFVVNTLKTMINKFVSFNPKDINFVFVGNTLKNMINEFVSFNQRILNSSIKLKTLITIF